MIKRLLLVFLCVCMPLASTAVRACGDHFYLDPNNLGFFDGAVARMIGLVPPKPAFELEHPAMLKAKIGESSEFVVTYSRPFFSKNVSIELSGTANVKLSQNKISLEERDGKILIPFQLTGPGFDSISLTLRGVHRGETVIQRRQIYIRAKVEPRKPDLQVTKR